VEHTDYRDVGGREQDHQDDETGIIAVDSAPDPWQRNRAWAERQEFANAVEQIQSRYERLLAPHRLTMKRNLGVKPPAVARLEAARDAEIRELTRAHQKAAAMAMAARNPTQRAVQAAERQMEQAAFNAFRQGPAGRLQAVPGPAVVRPGRAGTDTGEGFDLRATSRMIRSALRGGS
jgi:hypothetical protein